MGISYSPCKYLQEKDNSCVGQGKSKAQNPTPHDRIAEVENGHSHRSSSWDLGR